MTGADYWRPLRTCTAVVLGGEWTRSSRASVLLATSKCSAHTINVPRELARMHYVFALFVHTLFRTHASSKAHICQESNACAAEAFRKSIFLSPSHAVHASHVSLAPAFRLRTCNALPCHQMPHTHTLSLHERPLREHVSTHCKFTFMCGLGRNSLLSSRVHVAQ